MVREQQVILSLIRKAVNKDCIIDVAVFERVDWARVIEKATDQGVLGLCFEAVELLPEEQRPDLDNLMEFLGQVEYQKTEYQQKLDVASSFAAELAKSGIRTIVLKGVAFAQYYKHPEHRYSCDFDCFLSDYEQGNRIAERLGASVDRTEDKHSHIQYKGVHIENHRICTGVDNNGLEKYLESCLFVDGCNKLDGTELELPPLSFDALFCISHARTHFVVEDGIQLRHVVDWILIRRELKKYSLYSTFENDCKKYGMYKFLMSLNGIADLIESKKGEGDLTKAEGLMLEDILKDEGLRIKAEGDSGSKRSWFGARLRVLRQILHNSRKYSLYTDTTAWREIGRYLRKYVNRIIRQPESLKYIVK